MASVTAQPGRVLVIDSDPRIHDAIREILDAPPQVKEAGNRLSPNVTVANASSESAPYQVACALLPRDALVLKQAYPAAL